MSAVTDTERGADHAVTRHRLIGLEPDNLLAFLALLGLLRALEAADRERPHGERLRPRVAWDLDTLPRRPLLCFGRALSRVEILDAAASGIDLLARDQQFGGRKNLDHTWSEARQLLVGEARNATSETRNRADVVAALMTDGAVKEQKGATPPSIDPTPLCLMFGQGWQMFLERYSEIPAEPTPPPRRIGRVSVKLTASECLAEALFASWHRDDPTFSFRWDPEEDVRYALMAGCSATLETGARDTWFWSSSGHLRRLVEGASRCN